MTGLLADVPFWQWRPEDQERQAEKLRAMGIDPAFLFDSEAKVFTEEQFMAEVEELRRDYVKYYGDDDQDA